MRINTNVSALNTHRVLSQTNTEAARSIGRLSSGFRINRAADDAAGLAIANKFKADIRSLKVAQQNTTEATSMLQVAEGNTNTISNILGRMKELATQAASYNASSQTGTLDQEFTALKDEIDRVVGSAKYQGVGLLDGSFTGSFQIGASNDDDNKLDISLTSGSGGVGGGGGAGTTTKSIENPYDGSGFATFSLGADADLKGLAADGQYTLKASGGGDGNPLKFEILDKDGTSIASEEITVTNGDPVSFDLKVGGKSIATFSIADGGTFDAVGFDEVDLFEIKSTTTPPGNPTPPAATGKGLSTEDLGLDTIDLTDATNAQAALDAIDSAIDTVNSFLGTIGSTQNRLDYAAANIATTIENYSASESAIRDADMAAEMVNFTRNQIMQQAATAMLAQANAAPQGVLRLLS